MCEVIEIELAGRRALTLRDIHDMQIAHSRTRLQPTLKLVFAEVGPGPTLELGPFPLVRIDGETLRADPAGPVLAKHLPHSWEVQGRNFFRLDCESPVRLHFENQRGEISAVWGPFVHFSCADGIAYGDGVIYGNIDLETKRWYGHMDQKYWHVLVVKSATAPAA
jgi:hypothetical protein